MASALFRLFTLVALLLMPAGMVGAPALAEPTRAAASHCDEHGTPSQAPAEQKAHCAACAALAAFEADGTAAALRPKAPRLHARVQPVSDGEPEIATPPPKLS